MQALSSFHPLIQSWFEQRFPGGPTEPQERGWPAIASRRHTLIAAPTGSGKTLAAFLGCIDRLVRDPEPRGVSAIYVSPLKALASDIHCNLERPLAELRETAARRGVLLPEIRTAVRTGDTSAGERARMLRRPPHILVTTPESLYLMVTASKSREILRGADTLIVDEIHAVARDKRGSHLALTIERLEELCDGPLARVGLSATQSPIESIARLLVGARSDPRGRPDCEILDLGHRRELDLRLELPGSELGAVATHEQWAEILDDISRQVRERRTTLVFVNTRRLAERVAHLLAERLGEERVAAHHGSLSKTRRQTLEARLRAGDLDALVATASLELGIDVGPVELACQIGSPRSIATFLQRVGRSGHTLGATPRGRLYPTSRDELVECVALLRAVRAGRLDRIQLPHQPLDILAQQIVAACAAGEWDEGALFALVRRAAPFAELARADFERILAMLSEGVVTGRGRRGAYLHRDRVNGKLRARRGARIAALTSGGAIPETADYRVLAEPDDAFVGTLNEDFAIESMAGDVFLLGSTAWRIRRVEAGTVRVVDAQGAHPTIPFWLGEAPARTAELSDEVSALREEVSARLEGGGREAVASWLQADPAVDRDPAEQLARYLEVARDELGVLPGRRDLVFERFFDESGGMQLVVHSTCGGRLNRALGLALRKRFCKTFDFEIQAAANDDAVALSLGPQHSFALDEVPRFLSPDGVEDVLSRALLDSPMFQVRWRWNLGRALLVLRWRGGRKNPPPIQRMEADDLLAALFPRLAACQENATGPIEIPDQPLVRQTLHDCLHEACDIDGLRALLAGLRSGEIRAHFRDSTEPSVLSHEILNGRPYTFLDDAPLEERRTRAVAVRRGLPEHARDLGQLDPEAIARVRDEAHPVVRDPDELHDLLLNLVVLRPDPKYAEEFEALRAERRAGLLRADEAGLWYAAERRAAVAGMFPKAALEAGVGEGLEHPEAHAEDAAAESLRGHLDGLGPATAGQLCSRTGLSRERVDAALARLEAEGFVLRGGFTPGAGETEFCARRLLARIHRYTQQRLRREIEPVSMRDWIRFLVRWQGVCPEGSPRRPRDLLEVVEQLQGFEAAAGVWETHLLPARLRSYRREALDELCSAGEVAWGRLSVPREGVAGLTRVTPISLAVREDLPWLLRAARGDAGPPRPERGLPLELIGLFERGGALFDTELAAHAGAARAAVHEALWDLVGRGWVTADGFQALRQLLWRRRQSPTRRVRRGLRRAGRRAAATGGRFSLLPAAAPVERESLAEAVAEQLLARWGVVFRDVAARESLALAWREILYALRRLEDRGAVRGGRFVAGFAGEQFALPGAVEELRASRRAPGTLGPIRLSAADPLNLSGLAGAGPRIPALASRSIVIDDGRIRSAEI